MVVGNRTWRQKVEYLDATAERLFKYNSYYYLIRALTRDLFVKEIIITIYIVPTTIKFGF